MRAARLYAEVTKSYFPTVASLPLPFFTPTADFPIPFIAQWPLSGTANRLSYQFNRFTAIAYGGMINKFRHETLRLWPMNRWTDYLTTANGRPVPVLYGFSGHVVPDPRDYHSLGCALVQPSQRHFASRMMSRASSAGCLDGSRI